MIIYTSVLKKYITFIFFLLLQFVPDVYYMYIYYLYVMLIDFFLKFSSSDVIFVKK